MSSSGTQPPDEWRGGSDDQDNPGFGGQSGSSQWSSAQPTGWERPGSVPWSAPAASSPSASSPSGSSESASSESASSESASSERASSQPSASEWPRYPPSSQPSAPEPTRSFSADQSPTGPQPGYQPYDQQAMPGYGSGSSAGSGSYATNPYDTNPYETSPYQPNPYQPYGAYQAYAAPASHPQATTAFVLGLLGLVLCPPVGIAGLVMGGRVRREIDASGGQWGGRGLATAGWVLGIISVILVGLYVIFIGIAVVAGLAES